MHKISSFLTGAIVGALTGAAAALLLTPASGDDLQTQTRDWVDSLWRSARLAAESKRVELEHELATLKKQ